MENERATRTEEKANTTAEASASGKSDALLTAGDAVAISAVSTALGFPVPATIARSVLTAIGTLITSAVDVPVAYLQSWAQQVRSEASARADLTAQSVAVAMKTITNDQGLAE